MTVTRLRTIVVTLAIVGSLDGTYHLLVRPRVRAALGIPAPRPVELAHSLVALPTPETGTSGSQSGPEQSSNEI